MLWVASRWYFTLVIVTVVVVFGGGDGARVSCRLAIVIKERLLGWRGFSVSRETLNRRALCD